MNIRFRYKALGIIALWTLFLFMAKGCFDPKVPSGPLPKNETAKISVDPNKHTIIIQTPQGIKTETLPDRPSTFDVSSNGQVIVKSQQFGFEHHVFAGAVLSDSARLGLGMDGMYWKRLDIGLGVADGLQGSWPIGFAKATYNVYGNIQIGITYQSNQYLGGIASVRLF